MMVKKCPVCGQELETKTSQKYCSAECAYIAQRDRSREYQRERRVKMGVVMETRACPICGGEFVVRSTSSRIYCSEACRSRSWSSATICWMCRHSVPKIQGGKYVRGCSWSIHLEPVKGWTAEEVEKGAGTNSSFKTWRVKDCPHFQQETEADGLVPESHSTDDAYIRLVERVLQSQLRGYADALKAGDGGRITQIEADLRSDYYYALTMGQLDMDAYIESMRKKYGVI